MQEEKSKSEKREYSKKNTEERKTRSRGQDGENLSGLLILIFHLRISDAPCFWSPAFQVLGVLLLSPAY